MEIKVFNENGRVPVTVMHVDGNLDSSTHGKFLAKADELINGGANYILIDLSHTKFITSAGFRAFNDLFNKLRTLHPDANLSDEEVKKGIGAGTYKSPHIKLPFCAVRPPGHHAERGEPMGFCLFNNVAVGARYAQRRRGVERVAILDWDVHHGNGTQHIFEEDPSVLYVSLHQYPFYPGTGAASDRGIGAGEGATLNIPLPAGTGEERYRDEFVRRVVPALEEFAPGLLMISAGFDAHRDDPLADMRLTERSFGEFTRLVAPIAPIVSVLEGGYNLSALASSVEHHLRALIDVSS